MFVCDCLKRTRPRVQIAKSAITCDHVRNTFLHSAVLTVPVHVALEVHYSAPGGVTISLAGRGSEPGCRCKSSDTKCQFRKGFRHDVNSSPAIWWCARARSRASATASWATRRRTAATSSGGDYPVINHRMNMGDAMMNRPLIASRETVLRHRQ